MFCINTVAELLPALSLWCVNQQMLYLFNFLLFFWQMCFMSMSLVNGNTSHFQALWLSLLAFQILCAGICYSLLIVCDLDPDRFLQIRHPNGQLSEIVFQFSLKLTFASYCWWLVTSVYFCVSFTGFTVDSL